MLFSTHTQRLVKEYGTVKGIEMLAEAGFPAIDLSMYKATGELFEDGYEAVLEKLLSLAKEKGIVFHQAHAPYCSIDKYEAEAAPYMERAFEVAGRLGAKYIAVHPMYYPDRYRGFEREIFDMNVEYYTSLLPLAEKWGLKIAAENMWIYHPLTKKVLPSFLADPHEMVRLFEAVNCPEHFTMCLDIGHAAISGYEPDYCIKVLGKSVLGCIHAHDVDYTVDCHTLPGVRMVNWDAVCSSLATIGYKGSFNLEADAFYNGFGTDFFPTVARFMADTARNLAEKTDRYRTKEI